jgi:hypothetical protein
MLQSTRQLRGFTIRGKDRDLGNVDDLYFDDDQWTVRYVVVHAGKWLGQRVLISPMNITGLDPTQVIGVSLTKEQVRKSPREWQWPISGGYEQEYFQHFGFAPYWQAIAPTGGIRPLPDMLAAAGAQPVAQAEESSTQSRSKSGPNRTSTVPMMCWAPTYKRPMGPPDTWTIC